LEYKETIFININKLSVDIYYGKSYKICLFFLILIGDVLHIAIWEVLDIKKSKKDSKKEKRINSFDIFCEDRAEVLSNEIQRLYESIRLMQMLEQIRNDGFQSDYIANFDSITDNLSFKEKIMRSCKLPESKIFQKNNKNSEKSKLQYDISEKGCKLTITVYMPNIKKDEIEIKFNSNSLEIMPNSPKSEYYKYINLPCNVNKKAALFTFKNGVLDIIFEKEGD